MTSDGLSDHGVLAHKQNRIFPQRLSDLLHLFGSDIVDADDKAFRVFVQKLLSLNN